MTNIKTYAAGIIAAMGIAGAALIGAGTAAASTDAGPNQGPNVELHAERPDSSAHFSSPALSPNHIDAVRAYGQGGPTPTHTRHHHHAR